MIVSQGSLTRTTRKENGDGSTTVFEKRDDSFRAGGAPGSGFLLSRRKLERPCRRGKAHRRQLYPWVFGDYKSNISPRFSRAQLVQFIRRTDISRFPTLLGRNKMATAE